MAEYVNVVNCGSSTYTEEFKGDTITIKRGGRIKMPRREAVAFLSQMPAPDPKAPGKLREKMLKIEPLGEEEQKGQSEQEFVCHLDGKKFKTQEELDAYLKKVQHKTTSSEDIDDKLANAMRNKQEQT